MKRTIDEFLQEDKYLKVLFRKLVDLNTAYATHDLYPYPAKFIPHVVRFFLEKYTRPGDLVFDPFAGSGTLAVEAEITGRNYLLWDLNPFIEILVRAETWRGEVDERGLEADFDYASKFTPAWKNLHYWHPKQFVEVLSRAWGYYHSKPNPLMAVALLKVTKFFSYAELEFPKLHKSKVAIQRVESLLKDNWKERMKDMYREEASRMARKVREFQSLCKPSRGEVRGGVDVLYENPPEVDSVITSPPYLQAQEYIRSFKLELFWLGYTEDQVRTLGKREIPYNSPPPVEVESKTYKYYLEKVREVNHGHLLRIYTAYFSSLVSFLKKVRARTLGVFVGPVKVRNLRIPIDEILRECLEGEGWVHERTYIDTIVSRRMKRMKENPATGLEEELTPTEHLLVMKRG